MKTIRDLFDPSKPIDRRIEKVITYEATNEELLKQEVQEYVATESIEGHFDRMLDRLEEGMAGGDNIEVGVWVSGFYGSGKSSFTKYLGFALDPNRLIDGKPFLQWLQNQFSSLSLRQRLATTAKRFPAAVIMLDLASEQLAGATMAEISTVLYAKIMQWAGYSRDAKIAYLEFMLEKDGRLDDFKSRIAELSKGKTWDEIKNQPLVIKALASRAAVEFYPDLFPDSKTFNEIRIEEQIKEDDRVNNMLDLVQRKAGTRNIIFVLDEVGQYVMARDDLILNLDGLAKNIKNLGRGHAWIIATAQQTLTEDDPRAVTNTAKLFKLKDRFPVAIDLEASDIKEICFRRLLGKSPAGESTLNESFERYGSQLRYATELKGTKYYKSDLDKETFCKFYPFLPQHFDILLQLLARLAKTRGGVGLRSAIKVIQDVLVDPGKVRKGSPLLADENIGMLATTVTFYDTLRADIERPFPHITNGVSKAEKVFGTDSLHLNIAKSIAVLQILEDFPVSRENVAALIHPAVDAVALHDDVSKAVDEMLKEAVIPLNEVDGSLRFMSEAVIDLEQERLKIQPRIADTRNIHNTVLREIFTPVPTIKIQGTRSVSTGFKVYAGVMPVPLSGDKEPIQTYIEFVTAKEYDTKKDERILDSQQRVSTNTVFLLGTQDTEIDDILVDIYRCREIYKQNRNKAVDKDVEEYLRAQDQRAQNLEKDLEFRLKKTLSAGSFIFKGKPRSVGELGTDIIEATRKQLESVATQVFDKYAEAPVQTESATAERFLKTENLEKIPGKYDPLNLVKKSASTTPIDIQHKAIISVKDYLEDQGQVDGRRLLDDFFAPRFGWSKDTTRYIVAAMLVAGLVKLRVSGEDITVRGEVTINSLKNTNSFNKIGIALRDAPIDPDKLLRSRDRLLSLTAEEVMPLEEDISKCVMRHFPDFQQNYAPLAVQLDNLGLPGRDRAQSIQDNLAEILKGDASDAANRLGGQQCPLYDDLCWARDVKKAFDNGIGEIIQSARELLAEIPKLPASGIPGVLMLNTESSRSELAEYIAREDFFNHMPSMQNRIINIKGKVEQAAIQFIEEQDKKLENDKTRLQDLPEWGILGTDDKVRLVAELESLRVDVGNDLNGIKKLINDGYLFSNELSRIEKEIKTLAEKVGKKGENGDTDIVDVTLEVPKLVSSVNALNALIQKLQELKTQLEDGFTIKITWR
jgi:Family of unknown function (DUF6079)